MKKAAGLVLAVLSLIASAVTAGPAGAADPKYNVVADELDSPRGMQFGSDGALYVAETGKGGDQCNADNSVCFGATGAITRVDANGTRSRVLTGLPSRIVQGGPEGPFISGPTDVSPFGGQGYHLVASDGGVFSFGDAPFLGSTGDITLNKPIVDLIEHPSGLGYWLIASDGGVFNYGLAAFLGSAGDIKLNKPIVAALGSPTGKGYLLIASDGGVFAFGDAQFNGSTGDMVLNSPIVAALPTASGKGYLLIAADGGAFAFGDAVFKGSTGDMKLNKPIVTAIATPSGYLLIASDGGVFAFGAEFFGSTGDIKLNQPIVAAAGDPTNLGYWLFAADGGAFSFGDADFFGSTGDIKLNKPIVSADRTPVSFAFTIGWGGDPDDRDAAGAAGKAMAIAALFTGGNTWLPVADMGAYEKTANPAGGPEDTNPYAIWLEKGFAYAADAGADTIERIDPLGITTGFVLPKVPVPDDGTTDAVPTSIVKGPDGAYYIGQLTGYPFTPGAANIYRWVPGEAATVYRSGFSTIVDIAFAPNGNLYVSELRLAEGDGGQVVEVTPSNVRRVVMKGLALNTGLTVNGKGRVFVTNCGQCPGQGQVLSFDPADAPEGGITVPPPGG